MIVWHKFKNHPIETLPQWNAYAEHMLRVSSRKNIKISLYQKITNTLNTNYIYLFVIRKRCYSELYEMIRLNPPLQTCRAPCILCIWNTKILKFSNLRKADKYRFNRVWMNFFVVKLFNKWVVICLSWRTKKLALAASMKLFFFW